MKNLFSAFRVGLVRYPYLDLAFRRRQLAHGGGEHLVAHHRADALRRQQVFRVVRRREIERAEYALQSRIYRSNSASHLAAQMKSFSDSPPMAWVEYSTRHLLKPTARSG